MDVRQMSYQYRDSGKTFILIDPVVIKRALPAGNGVRVDTAIYTGYCIPSEYDSMIARLSCARTRP